MSKKEYFSSLDWLRGYATMGVLLYHAAFPFFSYWWIWVQVFFVISWFLITDILIKLKDIKNYFHYFYYRRILRIFPLYYLSLLIVIIYSLIKKYDLWDFLSYFLNVQNWTIWIKKWEILFPSMFWHSRTLAIEQQFYLIWPFFIRYLNLNKLFLVCIIWYLISIFSRFFFFWHYSWYLSSYSTFSHIDTLLWWAILAILYNKNYNLKYIFKYIVLLCLSSLIVYFLLYNYIWFDLFFQNIISSTDYAWVFLMIIVTPFSILLVNYLISFNNNFTEKIFRNKCIVFLWKISYWIYLYHVIVYYFVDDLINRSEFNNSIKTIISYFYSFNNSTNYSIYLGALLLLVLKIFLTIIISTISYMFFEKRFLLFKNRVIKIWK